MSDKLASTDEAILVRVGQVGKALDRLEARLHNHQMLLRSIQRSLALGGRDWTKTSTDAWLWGIFLGWPEDGEGDSTLTLSEVAEKHGWTPEAVATLKSMHASMINFINNEIFLPGEHHTHI